MDTDLFSVEPILKKLEGWFRDALEMTPNFILAVLVVIAAVLVARLTRKLFKRVLNKTYHNVELTRILSKIIYGAIVIGGGMLALSVLHLDKTVTSLLAGAGIVGLALSFAFQDIAANFVSGFFMAARRPFEVGDVIEVKGYVGTVLRINLRSTEIMTFDGNEVVMPNRYLFENPLTNYYRTKNRRVDLAVGVSYGEDLEKVEEVLKEAIGSLPNLVEEKDIHILFSEFGDSSINLVAMYWVPYDEYIQYLQGISDGVKVIKKAFDKNGITIPFPIRTLDFGIKGGEKLETQLKNVNSASSE